MNNRHLMLSKKASHIGQFRLRYYFLSLKNIKEKTTFCFGFIHTFFYHCGSDRDIETSLCIGGRDYYMELKAYRIP